MPDQPQLPPDPFAPYSPAHSNQFDSHLVGHLFRRAAFGPTAEHLDRFTNRPPSDALDFLFNFDPKDDPLNDTLEKLDGFLTPFNKIDQSQDWWIYRMLNTPHPLQEKIALFWHNRFATSAGKVENPIYMHNQIELFRRRGLGNYLDLVSAVGRDPAMLIWLDGRDNRKGKPNENYAREVMELFTLGIGNYTENDIKQLARAFTGWQIQNDKGTFNKDLFDDGPKEIFGQSDTFDYESATELLLSQPAAPKFLAKKMLQAFVHPDPDTAAVDHYAQRFRAEKWEIKPVLRDMLSSRMFFSDYAYRSKIKSPCELVIGSALALGGGRASTDYLRQSMAAMGQNLMYPPNVKGWDGEQTWINANTILLRYNFVMTIATQRGREMARKTDVKGALEKRQLTSAEKIVDYYSRLLLDGDLPDDMRPRLLAFMNDMKPPTPNAATRPEPNKAAATKPAAALAAASQPAKHEFAFSADSVHIKVRPLMHMMMATPEYQLA